MLWIIALFCAGSEATFVDTFCIGRLLGGFAYPRTFKTTILGHGIKTGNIFNVTFDCDKLRNSTTAAN